MPASPTSPGKSTVRLFLASRSPRRREMLREAGIPHESAHPGIEDSHLNPGAVTPAQWVAALAYLKARAGAALVPAPRERTVVLGADTTCVHRGHIVGTPVDAADAERMLRRFERDVHEVLTGVALVGPDGDRRELFVDRAVVRVGELGDRIGEYVAGGQWRGKAGAYNLGERLDAGWPIEYEGDPTTIMGLPMSALLPRLARHGLVPSTSGEAA